MGRPIEIGGRTFYEPKLRWKSGRAYIRFYDPTKRPAQKDFPLRTPDTATAEQLFHQRRWEYLNKGLDPWKERRVSGTTLENAVERYLKEQDIRASSRRCKKYRLEPFAVAHPGMLVAGVNADMVRAYCYRADLKTATQQRYLHELRHFLDYCQHHGWINENPATEVQKATPRRKKRKKRDLTEYLTPAEVVKIIKAIEEDIEANPKRQSRRVLVDVIHFAVVTGLRRGELCNLRWKDVRLYEPPRQSRSGGMLYGWLNVTSTAEAETKTGDSDRVPIVPQAYELLLRLRAQRSSASGYVFEAPRGKGKLQAWWVSDRFRHYRRAAKLRDEIHFHSLRHTCASWLAEAGVDLKVIQEILRHANIRQTMRYAHLIPEVVADKMVGAFEQITLNQAA
jgi:integrase